MAKNVQRESKFPDLMKNIPTTPTHTHAYTHTHEYVPTHTAKERKTRRVQLLMKESTVEALDSYAKAHDTSRNDIIQNLVDQFLKTNHV